MSTSESSRTSKSWQLSLKLGERERDNLYIPSLAGTVDKIDCGREREQDEWGLAIYES